MNGAFRLHTAWAAASALCALAAPANGAEWLHSARAPMSFRSWELESALGEKTQLSQLHIPLVTSLRLGPALDVVVSSAFGNSTLDPGGAADGLGEESLTGNGDVRAQIFLRLLGDRVLLQAGAGLPTGRKALDPAELRVAQALGNPLLGFRMKHYGEGLDLSGGGAVAFPLGASLTAAAGAGFVYRGEYEFVAGQPDFQPGEEISVSAGLDFTGGTSSPAVRLDASYRLFGPDRLDGDDIFDEGNQIELQATSRMRPAGARVDLAARVVSKEDNAILNPAGSDVEKVATDAGTAYFGRGETGLVRGRAFFGVAGDVTRFEGTAASEQVGTVFGVGPVLELALGDAAQVRVGGQVLFGQTDETEDGEGNVVPSTDLSGFDVTLSFVWAPGM